MKTTFTFLVVLMATLSIQAQELIRNGDFSDNDGTEHINGCAHWQMDSLIQDTLGSGFGDNASDFYVFLTGDDSSSYYQVLDVVGSDAKDYDLSFWANNEWNCEKVIVIISTSDADSTIRTVFVSDTLDLVESAGSTQTFSFSIEAASSIAGKNLILEFLPLNPTSNSWMHLDNVSLVKKDPGGNTKPVADAGDAQKVVGGTTVTLDGSGCSDADGDALTYTWTSQLPSIILSDRNAESPTFTAPDVDEITVLNFSLFVNDGSENSDVAEVAITVTPAGELIKNGDFTDRVEGWDADTIDGHNLKYLKNWNFDTDGDGILDGITGGMWALDMIHITSDDPNMYQVVETVSAAAATYKLSYTAKTSWWCDSVVSVFSVFDGDQTSRTALSSKGGAVTLDLGTGSGGDFLTFTQTFSFDNNSAYVGKKLCLEFFATKSASAGGTVNECWAQMQLVSLIRDGGTGINESMQSQLSIYPNPASSLVFVSAEDQINSVNIYSISGRLVKTIAQNDITVISVDDLTCGMYILSASTNNETLIQKLTIE